MNFEPENISKQSDNQKSENYQIHEDPNPIRIMAENISPRKYACIYAIVMMVYIAFGLTGGLIKISPFVQKTNEIQLNNTKSQGCQNPSDFINKTLICRPFADNYPRLGLIMRGTSPLNQIAFITMNASQQFSKAYNNTRTSVTLYSLQFVIETNQKNNKNYGYFRYKQVIAQKTFIFSGKSSSIGTYRHFTESDYLLVLQFQNVIYDYQNNESPVLHAQLINPKTTLGVIIFRGVMFCVTLISTIIFVIFYFKSPSYKRIFEQKIVIGLSISTLFFNNPLYILVVFHTSLYWTIVDFLLTLQSLVLWMIFITYLLRRNRSCKNYAIKFTSSRMEKIILCSFTLVFLVLIITYYVTFANQQYSSKDAFITFALQVSPGLAIASAVIYIIWAIFVFVEIVDGYFDAEACASSSVSSLLGTLMLGTSIVVFLTIFMSNSFNTPVIVAIFQFAMFNFNCLFVQFAFTGATSISCLFRKNDQITSDRNKFIEIDHSQFENTAVLQVEQVSRFSYGKISY